MKQTTLIFSAIFIWGWAILSTFALEEGRIASVNMERIFAQYHKTTQADDRLKEQVDVFNAKREEMLQALREMEQEFNAVREEAQDQSLAEDMRDERRNQAEEMLVELREEEKVLRSFEESTRAEIQEQGKRMRSRIVDQIEEAVEDFSIRNSLFAVVDLTGQSLNQVPVMVYMDEDADVTDEIIEILNMGVAAGGELEGQGEAEGDALEEESVADE